MFYQDSHHIYRAKPLEQLGWVEHGFGTRVAAPLVRGQKLITLRQVHSDICVSVDGHVDSVVEGDALLSSTPGLLLGIRTADCLPILIVDERHHALAAVHAGWRGTVRRIAAGAVEAMRTQFSSRPEDLHVAIGPGIGSCCYEVGPEVAVQFQPLFPEREDLAERAQLDLTEANRRLFLDTGVAAKRIYTHGLCTSCMAEEFHSYRRDREKAGRMLSVVGVRF